MTPLPRPTSSSTTPSALHRWGARARRLAAVGGVLIAMGTLFAPAAAADGVGPTNDRSVIDDVEPDLDAVDVEIIGGDSFLQVTAAEGTVVEIPGYDGEPYLRIDADGTVHQNERSPSALLNASRSGDVGRLPEDISSSAPPDWRRVGDGGRIAWHDHRIHWMLDEAPTVGDDGLVQSWEVPLRVDGRDVLVTGRLLHHEDELPFAALVAVVVAVGAAVLGRQQRLRAPLLVAAGAVATALSLGVWLENPPGAGASPLPLVLAGGALVASSIAVVWRGAPPVVRDLGLPLASVALLVGWVVPQIGVFWMPTVPSRLAEPLVRIGAALTIGLALGVAVAILLRPSTFDVPEAGDRR